MSVPGRANFVLYRDEVAMLHDMQDEHERKYGFRPNMAQIVSGLIRRAALASEEPTGPVCTLCELRLAKGD